MTDLITATFFSILAAGFIVGIVVGLTGMGGGALMTPALIFLGVGDAATMVTADLTAAAVYKTGGAIVHKRQGSPQHGAGQVAGARVGADGAGRALPRLLAGAARQISTRCSSSAIGFALLFAATTYALRLYVNLRRVRSGGAPEDEHPTIRPLPTLLVGALGGLLVGITSVGSGSVIMIALLMLYPGPLGGEAGRHRPGPGRPAGAGRRHLQHRPARARLGLTIPLIIGSVPGTILGSKHRAEGAAVVHPARHRRGADHVRRRPARQGRLGPARRR